MTRHRSDETRRTAIWLLVACVSAIAGRGQAQTPRKACDFLTKSEAEVLLGTSVVDRSQGADCFFVETGWTNKPPKNRAIRFGLTESASPQPGAVVELRRNAEQYMPAGGGIRDVAEFADAAYWLWIPGFGGTLTAFRGGTMTVSVNAVLRAGHRGLLGGLVGDAAQSEVDEGIRTPSVSHLSLSNGSGSSGRACRA